MIYLLLWKEESTGGRDRYLRELLFITAYGHLNIFNVTKKKKEEELLAILIATTVLLENSPVVSTEDWLEITFFFLWKFSIILLFIWHFYKDLGFFSSKVKRAICSSRTHFIFSSNVKKKPNTIFAYFSNCFVCFLKQC